MSAQRLLLIEGVSGLKAGLLMPFQRPFGPLERVFLGPLSCMRSAFCLLKRQRGRWMQQKRPADSAMLVFFVKLSFLQKKVF